MFMKKYILMLCCFLIFYTANIANSAPPCIASVVKSSKPQGTATLNKLLFHVYDVEFWSDSPKWNMNSPHALHLTYFVDIDGEDFVERSLEELQHNKNVDAVMLEDFKRILPPLLPNVVEGDNISAVYRPNMGLFFCHNGKSTGVLRNAEMEQAFMGIWLGESTSEPDIRKKLLKL